MPRKATRTPEQKRDQSRVRQARYQAKKRAERLALKALEPVIARTSKRCPRCVTEKLLSEFYADRSKVNGLRAWCQTCMREAKRAYRAAHPERVRAYKARYRNEHLEQERARDRRRNSMRQRKPSIVTTESREASRLRGQRYRIENAERKREQANRWAQRNRATVATNAKRWALANPDKVREKSKRWRQADPERCKALSKIHCNMRRARKVGATVERVDPQAVFARDGGMCGICTQPVDVNERWHIDHVVPLSKGGAHSYANVQLAHAMCNIKKGARLIAA